MDVHKMVLVTLLGKDNIEVCKPWQDSKRKWQKKIAKTLLWRLLNFKIKTFSLKNVYYNIQDITVTAG